MSSLILEAKNIYKAYQDKHKEKRVLKNFSSDFYSHQITAITGDSGSGKTTLLSILGLLEPYDSGSLSISGKEFRSISRRKAMQLRDYYFAYVFQRSGLIDKMSVRQNLTLPFIYKNNAVENYDKHIERVLNMFNLSINLRQKAESLSGGERIRLSLARAMLLPSKIILCDEPTAALDDTNAANIGVEFSKLAEMGICIIIATHDQRLLAYAHKEISLK